MLRFGSVVSASVLKGMYPQTRLKMTDRNFDVSRYSAMDKANLYFEIAIEEANANEQRNMLTASLYQASMAEVKPLDFLVEKISRLTIGQYENARTNIARTRNPDLIPKCSNGCNDNCAAGCQSKISLSVGEILENYINVSFEDCGETS